MGYSLAIIRIVGLILTYIIFGVIGLGLLTVYFLSIKSYYRSIVFFSQLWARYSCALLNIRVKIIQKSKVCPGSIIISNHVGTPDIFVLGSCFPGFFISKSEIGQWPFIGWLVNLGATILVDRDRKQQVRATIEELRRRLEADCSIILFPEGQATNGKDIVPFKSSYFETAIKTGKPVLPVVINYYDKGNPSIACWYNISFITHIIRLLKNKRLDVTIEVLPLIQNETDRKLLSSKCYDMIREKYLSYANRKVSAS
jgi:1-acyl-sn-glycerol-3-phosphate acyltransferase